MPFTFTQNDAIRVLDVNETNGEWLFLKAKELGEKLKDDGATVSQIRKIYSEIKKINFDREGEYKYQLRLIKAQIAYTAGRFNRQLKEFNNVFSLLIDRTVNGGEKELKRFKDFFEATIAYHRAAGGK